MNAPPERAEYARYTVVIPTVGRWSLCRTLDALSGPEDGVGLLAEIIVVDDRVRRDTALIPSGTRAGVSAPVRVLACGGRGPAAARNVGWRSASTPWVVFLDDDVVPDPGWRAAVTVDLAALPIGVAGSQGRVEVPLPSRRRPSDGERATVGLVGALWITADMAYRRAVLAEVGGFDETFRRAYREDTDLALRVLDQGYLLASGDRTTCHPLRGGGVWSSVTAQRGNTDDVVMRRRHGPRWRDRVGESRGRFRAHAVTTVALSLTAVSGVRAVWRASKRNTGAQAQRPARGMGAVRLAAVSGTAWVALTVDFAARRIARASRRPGESAGLFLTSAVIPPVACWYRFLGEVRHRDVAPVVRADTRGRASFPPPAAILFDRDGTLVHDVRYNGDPDLVAPVDGARDALDRVRRRGIPVGVVSNQSGVARGLISTDDVERVNARVEDLLGPFDVWRLCVHGEEDGCACRKPRPGLVEWAAAYLGVPAHRCVVIGDTGADVAAATAAGARSILVPNEQTRFDERYEAPETAETLARAVDLVLREASGAVLR